MMAALVWKEYREQRTIGVVFLLIALGLFALAPLLDGEIRALVCFLVLFFAAATHAVICGALLLAGEQEEKTQAYLDRLPVQRGVLWRGKVLAGLLLTLPLSGMYAVGLFFVPEVERWLLLFLPLAALLGLLWGLWGGSRSATVMGGILSAVLTGTLGMPLLIFVVLVPFRLLEIDRFWIDAVLLPVVGGLVYLVFPTVWAYRTYTQPDRLRLEIHPETEYFGGSKIRTCFHISMRSNGKTYLILLAVTVPLVLITPVAPLVLWPIFATLLGIILGGMLFHEEQTGPFRFLADQRLPLGILWATRVSLASLVLASVLLLKATLLFYVAITYRQTMAEMPPFEPIGLPLLGITIPIASWLLLWPITGFAVGAVVGLLFQKRIVALVVAGGLSAVLGGIWFPSLLLGGLQWWQPLLVPALLLATSRAMMHPWATQRSQVLPLAVTSGLAVLLTAAAMAFRVYSVPAVPVPDRLESFLAELPKPTEGSEQIRRACEEVYRRNESLRSVFVDETEQSRLQKVFDALGTQWPDDRELDTWLSETALAGDWPAELAEARKKPVGMLLDPRYVSPFYVPPAVQGAPLAASLLAADGLRAQRRENDPARLVQHLETMLVMARTFDGGQTNFGGITAYRIEQVIYQVVQTWLARLDGRPDLLERVRELLDRHPMPRDDTDYRLARYVMAKHELQEPEYVFSAPYLVTLKLDERARLTGALHLPWERERIDRQLRLMLFREPAAKNVGPFVDPMAFHRLDFLKYRQLALAITRLRIHLRLYELNNRDMPASLDALGIDIPRDPFGTGPIRYRLEDGEAVLWSVGPDGEDNDGHNAGDFLRQRLTRGQDYVFPVERAKR
jgi:hypothetical protein